MSVVEIRNIRKEFGDVKAVDGIDLAVREGEFVVLLGPSGCGKTTLLRMIAGLEKPTEGDVIIGDQIVNDLPPRARKIGMVFQSYALYPHMSVFDNIAFPLKAMRVPRDALRERVEWASSLFGIKRLLDRKPRQLSGGERQRVALARALVKEPTVMLLDEPLSNLDAKLRASARAELQQFQRRTGITTIFVTHDQVEAMGLGDRIAVMYQGKVRQFGTPQDIYHEPADTFVATFVGSPPMNLVDRDSYVVGFRPEHFLPREVSDAPATRLTTFDYHVVRVEYLGSDRLLYGSVDGSAKEVETIARLPSLVTVPIEANSRYEFAVHDDYIKYFDAETGVRTEVPDAEIAKARMSA